MRVLLCFLLGSVALATADKPADINAPYVNRQATDYSSNEKSALRQAATPIRRTKPARFGDVRHINRGGGATVREVLVDVRKTVFDNTIIPWAKTHRKIVAEGILLSAIIAQFACYYGFLGEKGEGLYEFAVDNEDVIRARIAKLGLRPGGLLRTTIEGFINSFQILPDRAKFAVSVSFAVSIFPVFVRCLIYLTKILLIGYANAELLALVGILGGTPGKGAIAWYTNEGGRGLFKSLGRAAESARLQIRKSVFKRYDMEPLVQKYVATVRKDKILWAGSAIGSVASVLLGGEVTPQ